MDKTESKFDLNPSTRDEYIRLMYKGYIELESSHKSLKAEVEALKDDQIKRDAKNKMILWIVGIVTAFFGVIAEKIISKR